MQRYDYIFAGSGLAALMTAYKMVRSGKFKAKRLLLLDPEDKRSNDRTWCFWEKEDGNWNDVVGMEWQNGRFADQRGVREFPFWPYRYKMIRSSRFYDKVRAELQRHPEVEWKTAKVTSSTDDGNGVTVYTDAGVVSGNKVFNSLYSPPDDPRFPVLQQHFIGWFIRAERDVFDETTATLMDFSVPQKGNTRFMYVLPLSPKEALVEYTLFSRELLPEREYEDAISSWLEEKGITDFEIVEKEQGSIPMTTFPFWKRNTPNILHIGTAGGWTKASTGYTFRNADKKSETLVEFLQTESDFTKFHKLSRFLFYDALLLDILWKNNGTGSRIFSSLFTKGNPSKVFKFLDEETSFPEDVAIIFRCPKAPFLSALWSRMFS